MRWIIVVGILGLGVGVSAAAAPPHDVMLELTVRSERIEGTPLTWDSQEVVLLGRDGRIWQFPPTDARDFRKTSDRFQGYSSSELRAMLLRELGDEYEVSGTGHYMVAHPRGTHDDWAQRFEDLYRAFYRYFTVRGLGIEEPQFLLIGVVCRDRADYARQASRDGGPVTPGTLGYYSIRTNRILLFDLAEGHAKSPRRQENAATVIHEATHQMAFNTGLHSRYVSPPRWLAEGLATVFEAAFLSDAPADGPRRSRANLARLEHFRTHVAPHHRPELLAEAIATDRLFQADPGLAYAQAWALSFWLIETQPRQYAEYLARVAARPPFEDYKAAHRLADFTAVFGDDWRMLGARLARFVEELD
jgi:hypothetical protein